MTATTRATGGAVPASSAPPNAPASTTIRSASEANRANSAGSSDAEARGNAVVAIGGFAALIAYDRAGAKR